MWRSKLSKMTKVEISLTLTDNQEIAEINKEFRKINKATDVLSFPMETDLSCWENFLEEDLILGDIIISLDKALEQASEYGHSLEREMVFLFVHGLLHLLGYDHENAEDELVMREEQREVLVEMGLSR